MIEPRNRKIERGVKDYQEGRTTNNEEIKHRIKKVAEINWTDEADQWLKDIYDYI